MATKSYQRWAWQESKKSVEKIKGDAPAGAKPVEVLLKSFDEGLGPILEKMAEAFKKNDSANVKRYANDALSKVTNYKSYVKAKESVVGKTIHAILDQSLKKTERELEALKANGTNVNFKVTN